MPTPPNHRKPWTSKDVKKVDQLAKRGVETPKIAQELGRTPDAVEAKASREQISLNPKDK